MKLGLMRMQGQIMWLQAKTFIKSKTEKITSKMSADDKLVVAMILIAIAAALCWLFRNSIREMLEKIFGSVNQTVENILSDTSSNSLNGNTGS